VNDDTTQTGSGIAVIRAGARVTIANNVIAPGPTQNFGADGIFIGGNREARYVVAANAIRIVSTYSDGIDITGGDPTGTTGTIEANIIANSVSLNGTFSFGIFMFDLVTKTKIAANSIGGKGMVAMGISTYGFNTNIASLNSFLGNDPRNFVANQSDLFYDTNAQENTEIGFCRSVIDLGIGNSSTCGPGGDSSGAQGLAVASAVGGASMSASSRAPVEKQQHVQLRQAIGRIAPEQVLR